MYPPPTSPPPTGTMPVSQIATMQLKIEAITSQSAAFVSAFHALATAKGVKTQKKAAWDAAQMKVQMSKTALDGAMMMVSNPMTQAQSDDIKAKVNQIASDLVAAQTAYMALGTAEMDVQSAQASFDSAYGNISYNINTLSDFWAQPTTKFVPEYMIPLSP